MAIILRKQARYCNSLAARNADPRISAALSRMGRRLSAEARRSVGKCTTRLPLT